MDKAHVIATKVVLEYIRELDCATNPIECWQSAYLAQRSYMRTAAYDILKLLQDDSEPPLVVIEEYKDKMDRYACLNAFGSSMFSAASLTAENIIDAIIGSCY